MFWRNISSPSLGVEGSKSSRKPAEAGDKLSRACCLVLLRWYTSKILGCPHATRCYNPEGWTHHRYCCENLKSSMNCILTYHCFAFYLCVMFTEILYKEYFYCVDRCAACRDAQTNIAHESACPTGNKVRNEVVTIHRSQEGAESAVLFTCRYFFAINCFIKNIYNNSCTYTTLDTNFHWMASAIVLPFLH
jgi:hypothetical protein